MKISIIDFRGLRTSIEVGSGIRDITFSDYDGNISLIFVDAGLPGVSGPNLDTTIRTITHEINEKALKQLNLKKLTQEDKG